MGQKVNPNGLRLGINKDWEAKWYANKKDFSKNLNKDVLIRKYFEEKLDNAGIAKIEIERNDKRCEVIVHTSKPGVMIGKGGEEIEKLKTTLSEIANEKVQISIVDIKKAELNAQLVADDIARQITNRISFRMAQKRAIRNAMKAGAKGIKTSVSGRLGGADMARKEGYTEGTIPLHTLRADVDYATAEADTTFGKIGVKVWIYKGEILGKSNKTEKVEKKNVKKSEGGK
jgi:small subunit ribosomal protein S3